MLTYQLFAGLEFSYKPMCGVIPGYVVLIERFPDTLTNAIQYCVSFTKVIVFDVEPSAAKNEVADFTPVPEP